MPHNPNPKQIHSATTSCQVFGKISLSLTGSLIIFDWMSLATFSLHISVSLVWQMRPIVDFFSSSPCHQSSGQPCCRWKWFQEKKQTRAATGVSKQSRRDQSWRAEENIACSHWRRLGGGEHLRNRSPRQKVPPTLQLMGRNGGAVTIY